MQSVSSMIWTRVTVSISYDDNHHTTGNVENPFIGITHESTLTLIGIPERDPSIGKTKFLGLNSNTCNYLTVCKQ